MHNTRQPYVRKQNGNSQQQGKMEGAEPGQHTDGSRTRNSRGRVQTTDIR